ncbi:MAG TPA: regulatory protein RecX [Myxococcota bacterium]|nr:regulatory protein RecX [Myxococcota bacterium]
MELFRKLLDKGHAPDEADAALDRLEAVGLLDDRRAAFGMARHFVHIRGYGPAKVRAKLREKGVAASLIEEAFAELEVDWRAHATSIAQRKSGKTRQQIARFLASRGFPSSVAWEVSASVSSSVSSSSLRAGDPSSGAEVEED